MSNSLIEAPFVPSWARKLKEEKFFIYNGPSMTPFFKPGDFLCATGSFLKDVRAGDIAILCWDSNATRPEHIVHRVISVKPDYLITQGDNNLKPDAQVVILDNLVGLVTYFGRQGHIYLVRGGYFGLFYAFVIHVRNFIWMLIRRLGCRAYRFIRQSGWVARVWRPSITQIRVMTDKGPLVKYCFGTKTVARWWPEQEHFEVVKPFDLVISHPEESK